MRFNTFQELLNHVSNIIWRCVSSCSLLCRDARFFSEKNMHLSFDTRYSVVCMTSFLNINAKVENCPSQAGTPTPSVWMTPPSPQALFRGECAGEWRHLWARTRRPRRLLLTDGAAAGHRRRPGRLPSHHAGGGVRADETARPRWGGVRTSGVPPPGASVARAVADGTPTGAQAASAVYRCWSGAKVPAGVVWWE